MNGIRVNEAFGDTVNWDFIPTIAIGRADVWTNNPVFGLNALGGAVSFQMKNGFTYQGFEVERMGGSYGRVGGSLQYGVRKGEWALYLAAKASRTTAGATSRRRGSARFYGDLGWKATDAEIHLVAPAADNYFGVVGPTPVELLDQRLPLDLHLAADHAEPGATARAQRPLRGDRPLDGAEQSLHPQLQAGARRRQRRRRRALQRHAAIRWSTRCASTTTASRPAARRTSSFRNSERPCRSTARPDPATPARRALGHGRPHLDQRADRRRLAAGHQRRQDFRPRQLFHHRRQHRPQPDRLQRQQRARLHLSGFLRRPERGRPRHRRRSSTPPAISATARSSLSARNTYYGLYVNDTFDITTRLSVDRGRALQPRQDRAWRTSSAPAPTSTATTRFQRFNPVSGLTYKIAAGADDVLRRLFGSQPRADAARARLLQSGAAVPARRLPGLRPAAAAGRRAHLRGRPARQQSTVAGGRVDWKLGLFRTDSENDIIQVASAHPGPRRVPERRRHAPPGPGSRRRITRPRNDLVYANYAFIDATYQFTGVLASPNNPSADANGDIFVTPGKHIPGIPRHQIKGGVDYFVTPQWKVGTDVIWVGSQWYVGDDANQNVKLRGLLGRQPARARIRSPRRCRSSAWSTICSIANSRPTAPISIRSRSCNAVANPPTDQRTITPAQPLSVYVGYARQAVGAHRRSASARPP